MKILFVFLVLCFSTMTSASIKLHQKVASALSMNASVKSDVLNLRDLKGYSIQAVITAASSPIGQLYIEVSNDMTATDNPSEVVHWSVLSETIVDLSDIDPSGADVIFNLQSANYKWARLGYDRTSGSGTLNATAVGKD